MIKLNVKSVKLFLRFLVKMQGLTELELNVDGHLPLHLVKGEDILTDQGQGYLLTIGLLRTGKNPKYEFAMTFIVVDQRQQTGLRLSLLVYPVSTRDDVNEVYEVSVAIDKGVVARYNKIYQMTHAKLAFKWLSELITAGYLR